jgi:hypothetical protein
VAKADPDGYALLSTLAGAHDLPATHRTLLTTPSATSPAWSRCQYAVPAGGLAAEIQRRASSSPPPRQARRAELCLGRPRRAAHINAERFRLSAGIEVQEIPFRGVQEALTELLAGRVDFFFTPALPAMPLIRDGKILRSR